MKYVVHPDKHVVGPLATNISKNYNNIIVRETHIGDKNDYN